MPVPDYAHPAARAVFRTWARDARTPIRLGSRFLTVRPALRFAFALPLLLAQAEELPGEGDQRAVEAFFGGGEDQQRAAGGAADRVLGQRSRRPTAAAGGR